MDLVLLDVSFIRKLLCLHYALEKECLKLYELLTKMTYIYCIGYANRNARRQFPGYSAQAVALVMQRVRDSTILFILKRMDCRIVGHWNACDTRSRVDILSVN